MRESGRAPGAGGSCVSRSAIANRQPPKIDDAAQAQFARKVFNYKLVKAGYSTPAKVGHRPGNTAGG